MTPLPTPPEVEAWEQVHPEAWNIMPRMTRFADAALAARTRQAEEEHVARVKAEASVKGEQKAKERHRREAETEHRRADQAEARCRDAEDERAEAVRRYERAEELWEQAKADNADLRAEVARVTADVEFLLPGARENEPWIDRNHPRRSGLSAGSIVAIAYGRIPLSAQRLPGDELDLAACEAHVGRPARAPQDRASRKSTVSGSPRSGAAPMTDPLMPELEALKYMAEGYDNHFNAGAPLMALHVAALAERLEKAEWIAVHETDDVVVSLRDTTQLESEYARRAQEGDVTCQDCGETMSGPELAVHHCGETP